MLATQRSNAPYRNNQHPPNNPTNDTVSRPMNNNLQSRSARNLMPRALPILERGGSTRNFRELPPDRRRGSTAMMENHRRNSTRRFFVDQNSSRGSSAATGSSTSTGAAPPHSHLRGSNTAVGASSLHSHLRGMHLERSDSNSSMGSFQSWGTQVSTLGSLNNSNSNHNSHSNNNTSVSNNDSIFSGLTEDTGSRAQRSLTSRSEDDSMMSLFSRDSVKVRRDQLDYSGHSSSQQNHNSINSRNNTPQGSYRDGMSVNTTDDDMLSVDSSECTIYSFDRGARPSALGPMSFHDSVMDDDVDHDWP